MKGRINLTEMLKFKIWMIIHLTKHKGVIWISTLLPNFSQIAHFGSIHPFTFHMHYINFIPQPPTQQKQTKSPNYSLHHPTPTPPPPSFSLLLSLEIWPMLEENLEAI